MLSLPTGQYRLYGVVSHKGDNLNCGHYIAAVRSLRDDQWYDCDDTLVKPINMRKLYEASEITATRPHTDPFILFYHRVQGSEHVSSLTEAMDQICPEHPATA